MDKELLLIIIGSSILFITVVIWKLMWIFKKISQEEENKPGDN